MSEPAGAQPFFRVYFGAEPVEARPDDVIVAASPLGEWTTEEIFGQMESVAPEAGVRLHRAGGLTVGALRERIVNGRYARETERVYGKMLAALKGRPLLRIWNYVPRINAESSGMENYRAFCVGRARAFEAAFGTGFAAQLPAASAVGCEGEELVIVFVAGEAVPRHFENPAQMPAYEYPAEHGPRSPSFVRATVASEGSRRFAFVSGTAAIRGHATVGAGNFEAQLACMLENLRMISRAAGLGDELRLVGDGSMRRYFKVYLRRADDYAKTRARLEQVLVRPEDEVIYLRADICRAELDVEIEATVVG